MKKRNKPIQAAVFFCVIPLLLATGSCTTQDKITADIHSWTKDVDSLTKGKADSRFWSNVRPRSTMVEAYTRLGGFYQKQGKHRKAIAEYIKAIKTKEADAGVYNSLAMSYDALKEYKFAEMAYKDAIALAPEHPYLYNNYGYSSLLRGDADAAAALFEKAASLDTESRRIKNNLSLAIHRGYKKEILNRDRQEMTQLPGLYVSERKVAADTDLKAENGNSEKVASVSPDEVVEIEEVETVSSPIVEDIDEPVKEVALTGSVEDQPDAEETAVLEVTGESVTETAVAEEVQVENVVTESAEVIEEVQFESDPPADVSAASMADTVPAETVPAQVTAHDREETALITATSSDDDLWYNNFIASALATLGFENDEKKEDVAGQVERDLPSVVTNTELPAEKNASVDDKVEAQENDVAEASIADTVPAVSVPAQVVVHDSEETVSITATSFDDEDLWYNNFIDSALASLGFVSDEKKADVAGPVESDVPSVVTNAELSAEKIASVDNKVEAQERVIEESIIDTAVSGNEPQEIMAVNPEQPESQVVYENAEDDILVEAVELSETVAIDKGFEGNSAELITVESVENKPLEREIVETVAVSTVEVPEATKEIIVGEINNEIFETVSTEVDVVAEDLITAVHAANLAPDSVKENVAVTAQSDAPPVVVNEIIVNTKPDKVIQVKSLQVADSMKNDIQPKSYIPIADAIVPTLYNAASVKRKVAVATDYGQDVQAKQKVAIEVSNGNGVTGMATRSAAYFREQGQYIRRITNAKHFGFKHSIVFYREGYLQEAYKIALMVPGYQEMKQVESLGRPEIAVKILLGKDMAPLQFPESMAGISSKKISTERVTVTLLSR